MNIMKDVTKKIRSKARMDVENRWWVAELSAADCEKEWIHPGWEDTMQKWFEWLERRKKKDEKEKMEEMHQQMVAQMIKSAEGSAGRLLIITKPTMWRRDALQLPKKDLAGAVRLFRAPDACTVRRMCGRAVTDHHGRSCQDPSGVVCFFVLYCRMRRVNPL